MTKLQSWIGAARLHTLPVSASSVLVAMAYAYHHHTFQPTPAIICLIFALLAQTISNFANNYFDFKKGVDTPNRVGHRRAAAEGEISPQAMLRTTLITLVITCLVGSSLLFYGPWWLILVGVSVAIFALAYSAGPYPLAYHGWGDVAVFIFFGIVPVNMTYYLQASTFSFDLFCASVAIGLLANNVLLVNNYRDVEGDALSGKRTTVVLFGRPFAKVLYALSAWVAVALTYKVWRGHSLCLIFPACYLLLHTLTWRAMCTNEGAALNPILGRTALNLLLFTLFLCGCLIF